jgi:DnaD/phage-associated family protein
MGDEAQARFAGFAEGRLRMIPIPEAFFRDLLPRIDDLAELQVTLVALYLLARAQGSRRFVTASQLAADPGLTQALAANAADAGSALQQGLEAAVARGTLLAVEPEGQPSADRCYFVNTPRGRAAAQGLADGRWSPEADELEVEAPEIERPNIFSLYEQNIGPLTPLIADELRLAEASYPARWIEDAMRIAVTNNVRKWTYVHAILDDWQTKGRDEREDLRDSEASRRRYAEGEFADFIEH